MKDFNLVDAVFSKNHHFEAGVLCTYGLNLNFFENYLMKLNVLYGCENICVFTDAGTYDNFIRESHPPRWLNRKYLVTRVKSAGVFHPKLYIFASEKRVVAGIGSANLTRDGIASNLELLSVFEVSEKDQTWAPVLRDCVAFVRRLAEITKSKSAIEQVDALSELCGTCLQGDSAVGIRLVHNLDAPLIETIQDFAKDYPISKFQIISPFYDPKLTPFDVFQRFFPNSEFEIYVQQKKSNFPKELFEDIKSRAVLMLYTNVDRYLHGKALLLHSDDSVLIFTGSANFTRSALLDRPPDGNYEVGLIGQIDKKAAENILCPTGKKAKKIKRMDEIEVISSSEFEAQAGLVDYITEAILNENRIEVTVDPGKVAETFTPEKFRLLDFNGNTYEERITESLTIDLTPGVKKNVPGKPAVQILGRGSRGSILESNIAWVVELEERTTDPRRRRLRRIYNDPSELIAILQEIADKGDKEELRRFLLEFDIPLDLVLPPRNSRRSGLGKSRGNVEGVLPKHRRFIFSAEIMEAYAECLSRLVHKLGCHVENPQVNKINNFIMILTSMYSLIYFVDTEWVYRSYVNSQIISIDDWALIRKYYGMLLKYVKQSWELVWSKGGYRDAINAKIARDRTDDQQNGFGSFEQYLTEECRYAFGELINFALQTAKHFEELKETLPLETNPGEIIRPEVFQHDIHLQPEALIEIREKIMATRDSLLALCDSDIVAEVSTAEMSG